MRITRAGIVAFATLASACATSPHPGPDGLSRSDGSISVFEMHPDPSVETLTVFSAGSVRTGSLRGPAQGVNGRTASWLDLTTSTDWKGVADLPTAQGVAFLSGWKGTPIGPTIDGNMYMRVPVEVHVDGSRISGPATDLLLARTPTGFRIQGTWLGAPWDVEVGPEKVTRTGAGRTRIWTRIEPGLYALEGRPQIRARFQGAAASPATAALPEAAFAVLLAHL